MSIPLTIPGLAVAAARRGPTDDAILDGDLRLNFAEVEEGMLACAAAFVEAGLAKGERVAIWAPNSAAWIIACLGLQAAGGVLVPLNTRFKAEEASYILRRSAAVMAVAAETFLEARYADLIEGLDLPAMRRVIRSDGRGWAEFLAAATPASRAEAERRLAALDPEDLSDIMFTSGTTGDPKGALSAHGQSAQTALLWAAATTLTKGDRFLIVWPFFHCSGYKAGWVANLAVGAASLPVPVFDASSLLEIVDRERVSFLPGPPALFQSLLALPDRPEKILSTVRVSITGASAVPPSMITAMREELGIQTVLTGYGLTETCGTATMTGPSDPPEVVTTSCGRAIPGVEVACVGEDNKPVPTGQAGEVVVRGMNVMRGYLDDPEATAEAIDVDGWLHTGDIGVLDADGYLRITDRKKDVIIVGGFNCYPAEIEKMLSAHPAIHQVAVTAAPDARMGEVPQAFVVLKPQARLTEVELIAWARERMANFKVPRHVAFLEALPTNATGKIQKFKLAGSAVSPPARAAEPTAGTGHE